MPSGSYAHPFERADPISSQIVGHVHVTVQPMDDIKSTKVLDPQNFDFFKGFDFGDGE